ncbi:MAG TPA: transglutaminase-like cysteine peptidase [Stellaceae bacterium]|nr:transglutaminase-like cysteine peptidase [Stellaceae bacterium]
MQHIYKAFTIVLLVLSLFAGLDARANQGGSRSYPALFGTHETYSPAIDRFYKWTGMLQRWTAERRDASQPCLLGQTTGCEPREWRRIVDLLTPLDLRAKIEAVNSLVNRYPYIPSAANWSEPNYWETPFEFLIKSGQCQDYAIAKFMLLRAAGVPNELLRVVVLRDRRLSLDHAVMVAYVDGEALMLDNQIPDVVPVAGIRHYQPYYSINETGWWLHDPNPLQVTSVSLR